MPANRLFRWGLGLLILGTGPLLLIGVFDPEANPVGPGLLAGLTFWPALGMMLAGWVRR